MREGFETNLWVKSRVNVLGVNFWKSLLFYFSGTNLNGVKAQYSTGVI